VQIGQDAAKTAFAGPKREKRWSHGRNVGKTAAERPKRGKQLKRWKIGGRTAETWETAETMENRWPNGQNVEYGSGRNPAARQRNLHFSAARQQCTPPSQAEGQGTRGGLSFPGILGGRWLSPPGLWGTDIGRVYGRNAAIRVGFGGISTGLEQNPPT
jgi:hypothetical protein